MKQLEDSNMCW